MQLLVEDRKVANMVDLLEDKLVNSLVHHLGNLVWVEDNLVVDMMVEDMIDQLGMDNYQRVEDKQVDQVVGMNLMVVDMMVVNKVDLVVNMVDQLVEGMLVDLQVDKKVEHKVDLLVDNRVEGTMVVVGNQVLVEDMIHQLGMMVVVRMMHLNNQ